MGPTVDAPVYTRGVTRWVRNLYVRYTGPRTRVSPIPTLPCCCKIRVVFRGGACRRPSFVPAAPKVHPVVGVQHEWLVANTAFQGGGSCLPKTHLEGSAEIKYPGAGAHAMQQTSIAGAVNIEPIAGFSGNVNTGQNESLPPQVEGVFEWEAACWTPRLAGTSSATAVTEKTSCVACGGETRNTTIDTPSHIQRRGATMRCIDRQ